MKKLLFIVLMLSLTIPAMARSDNRGSNNGKGLQAESARYSSLNQNPNSDRKCYYCYKDLSTQYTPSRHKYGKTQ
jgi:hypothetical protein